MAALRCAPEAAICQPSHHLGLEAELKRAGVTYADLAERLKEHGLIGETEASIKAKLKRGTFPTTFLLASMAAIGVAAVAIEDL